MPVEEILTVQREKQEEEQHPYHVNQLAVAFAGGAASCVTRVFVQPLDVLKIRFQLQVEPLGKRSARSKYKTITQATRLIWKEEGIGAFWKGHTPAQILSIAYGIAQFWAYEQFIEKAKETHFHDRHKNLSYFLCGGLAGAFGTIVTTPLDVIRTRLIAQDKQKGYKTTWNALVTIVQIEGYRGLYRGIIPGLLQITPLMGVNFMFYNLFCNKVTDFLRLQSKSELPALVALTSGALAGVLSKGMLYPLDLFRKRMQIQGFQEHRRSFGVHFTCNGLFSCLITTVKQEGVFGMYKGMTASIWKAALTSALNFALYDNIVNVVFN